MENILDTFFELLSNIKTEYLYISFMVIALLLLISIILSKNKKKKKEEKSKKTNTIKETENQIYNPLKNNNNTTINSNLSNLTVEKDSKKEKGKKGKKVKKTKKELKAEKEFQDELQLCINAYNQLYNVYYNEGYSVDLTQNNTLAYYTSLIQSTRDIDEIKNICANISFQTVRVIDEIKCFKEKENLERQRKILYDECVVKIAELNKLFTVLNLSGERTIREFNDRLLSSGMFAGLNDYQLIYNDLIQNIEFIKSKYKDTLDNLIGKNSNEIDVRLIESLKILNCNLDETNLSVIKRNYLLLVKKYHPDTNSDSAASIEMSSRVNDAYTYVKKALAAKKEEEKKD